MLGNLARSVLRGEGSRDAPALPDLIQVPQSESTMWTSLSILAAFLLDSCFSEEITGKLNRPKTSANTVVGCRGNPSSSNRQSENLNEEKRSTRSRE